MIKGNYLIIFLHGGQVALPLAKCLGIEMENWVSVILTKQERLDFLDTGHCVQDNVDTGRRVTVMTKLCDTFQLLNDCQLKIIDMH